MDDLPSRVPGSRRRLPDAWLLSILAGHVVLAFLLFSPQPYTGGDNAHYMILAWSIETGQGYRDLHIVGAPLHAKYPPLYPAVLAAARSMGGGLTTFKAMSIVFTTTALGFLFLIGRRRMGRKSALLMTGVVAVNPVLLEYSHWVLSESLFILLVLVAVWAIDREDDGWRWTAFALAASVLAYLTRTAGLALLLALCVSIGWRRRWARLGIVGLVAGAVVGAWLRWVAKAVDSGAVAYGTDFLRVDPYSADDGLVGLGGLLIRISANAWTYVTDVLPESLSGGRSGVAGLAMIAGLLVVGSALLTWWQGTRRGRVPELFVLFYTGLILVWPTRWTDKRLLLPLLPVLLLLAAEAMSQARVLADRKLRAWVFPFFAACLILLTVPVHVQQIPAARACHGEYRRGDDLACYHPVWRSFVESARWVRANTAADAVIVSRKPRLFFYFARRQTAPFPFEGEDGEKLAAFDAADADYVVVSAWPPASERFLVPLILRRPDRFRQLYETGVEPFEAYVLGYLAESHAEDLQP